MDASRDALPDANAPAPKPRRKRWPLVALLGVIGIGGLVAWQLQSTASEPTEEEIAAATAPAAETVMRLASVDVSTIAVGTLSRQVKVTGTTHPLRHANLSAQVSGTVTAVNFRAGDRVSEGDVIVQQDLRDLQITLNQATANRDATAAQLALSERQLASVEALNQREFSSTSSLESAQSAVATARAQLAALTAQVEAAEVAIDKATIRAPFDGTIATRSVEPNQMLSPSTAVITLVDLSQIEARVTAPISRATAIAPGQQVSLIVENSARTVTGTVDRINPVAAEGTRSIELYVTVDNADGYLRGGMFVTGNVVTEEKTDTIGVPAAAIHEDGEGPYVLKLVDNVAQRQPVELGPVWAADGTTEIVSGLAAGDRIVNTALDRLEPGSRVAVAEVN